MGIQEIQDRVQELYDIPLENFTAEHRTELNQLIDQAETMGYERAEDDSIDAIRFVKRES